MSEIKVAHSAFQDSETEDMSIIYIERPHDKIEILCISDPSTVIEKIHWSAVSGTVLESLVIGGKTLEVDNKRPIDAHKGDVTN